MGKDDKCEWGRLCGGGRWWAGHWWTQKEATEGEKEDEEEYKERGGEEDGQHLVPMACEPTTVGLRAVLYW